MNTKPPKPEYIFTDEISEFDWEGVEVVKKIGLKLGAVDTARDKIKLQGYRKLIRNLRLGYEIDKKLSSGEINFKTMEFYDFCLWKAYKKSLPKPGKTNVMILGNK